MRNLVSFFLRETMGSKKIVVTGGAGFIGSNLVKELAKQHEVIVIDDLSTGKIKNISENIGQVRFVRGCINDLSLLNNILVDVDCIFHQAAIPSVQRSIANPLATNKANVDGTLAVLSAAKACGVKKVIYASSSSVYGDTPTLPKRESMNPNPKSPYAVSKLAGEYYCKAFSEVYGLKTVCLRYFNVYGPKQDPQSYYAAVIPRFITRVLKNESPIIFGDGNQTRDFTFVKDVVKANILAMESDCEGIFNIAYGSHSSINDLVNKIIELKGMRLDAIYKEPRRGDVMHSLADITSAKEKLGYHPQYNLARGLEETFQWFLNLKTN